MSGKEEFRILPSISEVDEFLQSQGMSHGRVVRNRVHEALSQVRLNIQQSANPVQPGGSPPASKQEVLSFIADLLQDNACPRRVINATGVVIHTNLGRAPLPEIVFASLQSRLCSYSTLEFDLKTGKRGSRDTRIRELLRNLSGAEDAMLVNNNAAGVLLMLKTLAEGMEVIVSRGELVEIGGSFRIPDIMKESGAKLVEVGTTNRTRVADYEYAISENTAAILKVHPSNYVIHGFTESVDISQLVKLSRLHRLMCLHDWGSGTFYQFRQPALHSYPTAQKEIQAGPDVLCFSADKLLGGVQGGIVLGSSEAIGRMRRHPLYRTLRPDKVCLAIMENVLEKYFDPRSLPEKIPTIGLLEKTTESIRKQAGKVLKQLPLSSHPTWTGTLQVTESRTGGGALPELPLPSCALVISHPEVDAQELQSWLRSRPLPVIVRLQDEQIRLDFRTVLDRDVDELTATLEEMIIQFAVD